MREEYRRRRQSLVSSPLRISTQTCFPRYQIWSTTSRWRSAPSKRKATIAGADRCYRCFAILISKQTCQQPEIDTETPRTNRELVSEDEKRALRKLMAYMGEERIERRCRILGTISCKNRWKYDQGQPDKRYRRRSGPHLVGISAQAIVHCDRNVVFRGFSHYGDDISLPRQLPRAAEPRRNPREDISID